MACVLRLACQHTYLFAPCRRAECRAAPRRRAARRGKVQEHACACVATHVHACACNRRALCMPPLLPLHTHARAHPMTRNTQNTRLQRAQNTHLRRPRRAQLPATPTDQQHMLLRCRCSSTLVLSLILSKATFQDPFRPLCAQHAPAAAALQQCKRNPGARLCHAGG